MQGGSVIQSSETIKVKNLKKIIQFYKRFYRNNKVNICIIFSFRDVKLPCNARVTDPSGVSTDDDVDNLQPCYTPKCPTKQDKT